MGFANLAALSFVMFVGAFVVGLIPLTLSISQRRLKFITTFGVGVLVGVAFIVIIPEGMHTVYGLHSAHSQENTHSHATQLTTQRNGTRWLRSAVSDSESATNLHSDAVNGNSKHDNDHDEHNEDHLHDAETGGSASPARCIDSSVRSSSVGAALALGFVFMLLVDRLSGGHSHGFDSAHDHGHGGPADRDREHERTAVLSPNSSSAASASSSAAASLAIELTPLTQRDSYSLSHRENTGSTVPNQSSTVNAPSVRRFDQSATVGILVHSAVDGVALGAISVSENSALELVVFLAIILHKAPAAFGLASFLLYQGRSHEEIRSHLFIFSMAAPVTALLTFFLLGQSNSVNADNQTSLGLCLLFSGGTFLFTVAVHILPEVNKPGEQVEWKYVIALIIGILSPLLLANEQTHAHAHGN